MNSTTIILVDDDLTINYFHKILLKTFFDQEHIKTCFNGKQAIATLLSLNDKLDKKDTVIVLLDLNIIDLFKEITSHNTIIASQGTFSFWACFLSNADKIYFPITNDGPNSGKNSDKPVFKDYVNLIVDDEPRYEYINVPNIYKR
jgi:hypothetical protein